MGLFSVKFELCVGRNCIQLKNLKAGKSISRTPAEEFSSPKLLIAQPERFSAFVMQTFLDMEGGKIWAIPDVEVSSRDAEFNELEIQFLRKMLVDAGFQKVSFKPWSRNES